MSKKVKNLFEECKNRSYHVSISYQSITSYSVEIYKGYVSNYKKVFYTDGHVELKSAIESALLFLKNED